MAGYKQREFFEAVLFDEDCDTVVFGGARFNGKTWSNCAIAPLCCLMWPGIRVLMLRRIMGTTEATLGEEIERFHETLGLPDDYVLKLTQRGQYRYPNGSYIQLGYCRLEDDWERFKSLQFEFIFIEEGTQFLESQFDGLRGSVRARRPQPGLKPKKVLTTNPDGIGMRWCKRRFVNESTRDEGVRYIGCKVRDSLPTLERDPGYVMRELRKLPKWQQKQWELGDWDSQAGQYWAINPEYFKPVEIPEYAEFFAGVDEGYWPDPWAVVWFAKWMDFREKKHRIHVFKAIKRHKLTHTEKANTVKEIERDFDRPVKARWADPKCWTRHETDTGMSTTAAHIWAQNGFVVSPAFSNNRVGGWNLIRTLKKDTVLTIDPIEAAPLYAEFIDAIHGKNSEDMDDKCEDHCSDGLRYGIVSSFAGGYRSQQTDQGKRDRESRKAKVQRLARGGYAS